MLRFTVTVKNAKSLDIAFRGLVGKIRDWRALWPAVITQLCKAEDRAFSTQGALTEHGEWAQLSPDYERAKRKKYGDQMIETASSRLRASLTGSTADTIEDLQPLKMRWGTSVPYAMWQQTGTKTMPARRLMDFTEEDRVVVQKQIQREAVKFSRRLGFKVISEAGDDVSQFSLAEIRQAGVDYLNKGAPTMDWGAPLW